MASGPMSLTVRISGSGGRRRVVITTWGVTGGKYGSLGTVSVPAVGDIDPASLQDVARVVLTALYGLDYDL